MPPKPIQPELLSLRRENALKLFVRWRLQEIAVGRAGGDKAFAEAVGIDNAHWSRLKAGTPLGPKLARRLEAACGVEAGWLDVSHDEAADERVSRVDLNAEFIRHEEATVMISVVDDSMRDAGILDGNVLLVDKALDAEHGDIVVAVLDEALTIRRLYRKEGVIKLLADHPDFPEIVLADGQEPRIWGVVTATIRRFRHTL